MALGKKKRFEVFKRDGFTCQYCGCTPPEVVLEVDHVLAVANGGGDEMDNLVTSCFDCNRGKSSTPLDIVPQSLSGKAARVAEREEQLRAYAEVMREARERIDADTWEVADIFIQHFRDTGIKKDCFLSIKRFIEQMPVHECISAMEIAVAKRPYSKNYAFRYFCGICWKIIKGRNE